MISRFLLVITLFPATGYGGEPLFSGDPPSWTLLKFEAKALWKTIQTQISLEESNLQALPGDLPEPSQGVLLRPEQPKLYLMRVDSNAFGTTGLVQSWFQPNGEAVLGKKMNTGKKNYRKVYRFTQDGVYTHRLSPKKRSEKKNPLSWSKLVEHYDVFPFEEGKRHPVSEAPVIFYLVAASNLNAVGDRFAFYCWSGKELVKIAPEVTRILEMDLAYLSRKGDEEQHIEERAEVLEIILPASPVGFGESSFKLLGLKGDLRLYLRRENRMPVRLSGKASVLDLDVELTEVWESVEH